MIEIVCFAVETFSGTAFYLLGFVSSLIDMILVEGKKLS